MQLDLEELVSRFRAWFIRNRRALFILGLLIVTGWLLVTVWDITLLLIVAYTFAVLIEPVVRRLTRKNISRPIAVFAVISGYLLIALVVCFLLIPPILSQYGELVADLPTTFQRFTKSLQTAAQRYHILAPRIDDLAVWAPKALTSENLGKLGQEALAFVLGGYSLTLSIFNIVLLFIFLFYISVELHQIHRTIGDLFPYQTRLKLRRVTDEILTLIYGFFRGQSLVCLAMALLYGAGLALVGVPQGFAIGVLSGLINFIPYVGVVVGVFLSMTSMLMADPSWSSVISVAAVFAVVQMIEGTILTPRIMGERTGIPPLGVILALLVGGELLGLVGIVIAIPVAAALKVILRFLWNEVRAPVAEDALAK